MSMVSLSTAGIACMLHKMVYIMVHVHGPTRYECLVPRRTHTFQQLLAQSQRCHCKGVTASVGLDSNRRWWCSLPQALKTHPLLSCASARGAWQVHNVDDCSANAEHAATHDRCNAPIVHQTKDWWKHEGHNRIDNAVPNHRAPVAS